jgi:hypothetical protein
MVIFPIHPYASGPIAKVVDADGVEETPDLDADVQPHLLGNAIFRPGTLLAGRFAGAKDQFEGSLGGPDDISKGDVGRVFQKEIPAVGASLASKNIGFLEPLEDLLEVSGTDLLPSRDVLDLGGQTNGMVSDVEQCADAVSALGGKPHY